MTSPTTRTALAPNLNGTTVIDGKVVPVMQQGGGILKLGETPIGPTGDLHHYFLGADNLGRDVAALLLYGGRASLQIGISSAVICCVIATIVALIAGFFGGTDRRDLVPADGRDLGVPGLPAGDLDLDRAAHPLQRRRRSARCTSARPACGRRR